MRISLILLFVFALHINAEHSYSQSAKISLDMKNSSIEKVLQTIEEKSDYYFLYSNRLINVDRIVSLKVKNAAISSVLDRLFTSHDVEYEVKGSQIILSPKEISEITNDLLASKQQQGKTITGTIVDAQGEAIIGANIIEKGTTNGTVTDFDGNFRLNVEDGALVHISYIGYLSQEINTAGRTRLDIVLLEDTQSLEELVVVGYGVEKKANLTGSVATVTPSEIQGRPRQNVTTLLQGKAPGLFIHTNSGRPGKEGVNVVMRGLASYGTNNSPLVIVDGVPGSMDLLNPEDIQAISILKDAASASIYGSRAANGVILVTTNKGGKGKPTITYNASYAIQKPTFIGNQIWNSAQYMELWNQLADRVGGRIKYPETLIAKYKDPNKDKIKYPDYNWMKGTFNDGLLMTHNININGSTEKTSYNMSFGYQDNQGIAKSDRYRKYTGLVSIETELYRWLKVGTNTKMLKGDINESWYTDENGMPLLGCTNAPMYMPYLPDGSGRYAQLAFPLTLGGTGVNRNAIAMQNETEKLTNNYSVNPQAYADITFLNNDRITLTSHTLGSFNLYQSFANSYYPAVIPFYYYLKESDYMAGGRDEYVVSNPTGSPATVGVSNNWSRNTSTTWFSTLNFNWNIDEDNPISVMVGYQEETSNSRYISGSRRTYPTAGMRELNGGSAEGQSLSGNLSSEVAIRSVFGRLKYSYKNRYLVEGNFRRDGTSRLASESRWGTFPSLSAAWRASEESFIKSNLKWIDDLKIRGSWGNLGNSEVGTYTYQSTYNINSYIFGGESHQSAISPDFRNRELQWEKTTVTDFGLDMTIFKGLFGMTFDWYNKFTSGILASLPVPQSFGLSGPVVNFGEMKNTGVELEINHKNNIGDLGYMISFMASRNKNELLKVRVPSYGTYIVEEGIPYRSYYLYVWDGIFQSEEDIQNHPTQPYANPKPGDIYYKDLNGDGKVDGDDRQVTDGVYPKMLYSGNINLTYKNFDLNAFFQGISGKKQLAWQWVVDPFTTGGPPDKRFLNAWTPTNTDTDVPALYYSGYGPMNYMSTYYLENSSYLRLKNLTIGYNVPGSISSKLKVQGLRIYLSGENLFTITDYGYGMDPENDQGKTDTVVKYPQLKSFSAGIRLTL